MSSKCGKSYVTVQKQLGNNFEIVSFPILCGNRFCPRCAKVRAHKLRMRMKRAFEARKKYFITLTLPARTSIENSYKYLWPNWNRLRANLSRDIGKLTFVAIVEHHDNGKVHLHIICDKNFTKAENYKNRASKCGFGYIFDAQEVENKGAEKYVQKYVEKGFTNEKAKKYCQKYRIRTISYSRDIKPLEKMDTEVVEYATDWSKDYSQETLLRGELSAAASAGAYISGSRREGTAIISMEFPDFEILHVEKVGTHVLFVFPNCAVPVNNYRVYYKGGYYETFDKDNVFFVA